MLKRCKWAENSELLMDYHDHEWGQPIFNDDKLFEYLTLEGAQAGLNWITVLKKREHYLRAFHDFSIERVANYTSKEQEDLLQNPNLIQHKLKLQSVIHNANCILRVQAKYGSFSNFLWSFVERKPIINQWLSHHDVPSATPLSETLSKSLKSYGFKYVGPTICYSLMQATGMIQDHTSDCFMFQKIDQ